jgi:plastocyanin
LSRGLDELEMKNGLGKEADESMVDYRVPTRKPRPRRQPLSPFSKTSIAALFVLATLMTALGIFVHQPTVLILAGVELLIIVLITAGIRWAPILGSILGSIVLYVFVFLADYPLAHLSHPKDVYGPGVLPWLSFTVFTAMLLIFWSTAMLIVTGIPAVIQNYFQRERRKPRWFNVALATAIGIFLGAVILGALQQPVAQAAATSSNGTPTVHLYTGSFSQSSITISKGEKLTLVDDGAYHHNISDGTWVNGQPMIAVQPGEPVVKNHNINGAGATLVIGPFNTAGTFHLMCSLHHGMMLTVIVK